MSLCLINYALCHEIIWGSGCIAPPSLTSALDRGEGQLHEPAALPSATHWIWGWMGPRRDVNAEEKRKILPYRESNQGIVAHTPLLYQLKYPDSVLWLHWTDGRRMSTARYWLSLQNYNSVNYLKDKPHRAASSVSSPWISRGYA
jgi:hypothetical protein